VIPVEEVRVGAGLEVVEGERSPDLGVEIDVAFEVDHRKRLSIQLLQERPVVDPPKLLPAHGRELWVPLRALAAAPLQRLPNGNRVADHPDGLGV